MKILRTPEAMRSFSDRQRRQGKSIGFVPTMGALHRGHLSLIQRARQENDCTVVSIFVNPLQFGPKEDFNRYPRPAAKDDRLCRQAGVNALYRPTVAAMYPVGYATQVEVRGLSDRLCGRFRPGHFQGVATVVLKLFEAATPDRAYFGEKDFQQLTILRRMATDLNLPVRIVGCPTIREADGLALSSRNAYLGPEERRLAPLLNEALTIGAMLCRKRGMTPARARSAAIRRIQSIPGVRIDYVEVVDPETLSPVRRLQGPMRIAAAIRVGKTRLIDNIAAFCDD